MCSYVYLRLFNFVQESGEDREGPDVLPPLPDPTFSTTPRGHSFLFDPNLACVYKEGSFGLVVERRREEKEMDGLIYYEDFETCDLACKRN